MHREKTTQDRYLPFVSLLINQAGTGENMLPLPLVLIIKILRCPPRLLPVFVTLSRVLSCYEVQHVLKGQ